MKKEKSISRSKRILRRIEIDKYNEIVARVTELQNSEEFTVLINDLAIYKRELFFHKLTTILQLVLIGTSVYGYTFLSKSENFVSDGDSIDYDLFFLVSSLALTGVFGHSFFFSNAVNSLRDEGKQIAQDLQEAGFPIEAATLGGESQDEGLLDMIPAVSREIFSTLGNSEQTVFITAHDMTDGDDVESQRDENFGLLKATRKRK